MGFHSIDHATEALPLHFCRVPAYAEGAVRLQNLWYIHPLVLGARFTASRARLSSSSLRVSRSSSALTSSPTFLHFARRVGAPRCVPHSGDDDPRGGAKGRAG